MSEHEYFGCYEPIPRNTPSLPFHNILILKRIISQESYYVNDKQLQTINKPIFSSFKTISKSFNVVLYIKAMLGSRALTHTPVDLFFLLFESVNRYSLQ